MSGLALNLLFAVVLGTLTLVAVVRAIVPARVTRTPIVLLALIWGAAVAFMTLRPGTGLGVRLNLVPLQFDGTGSEIDAVLNTFVFLPLGLLMVLTGARLRTVAAVALASTLAIEVTQYATDLGRTADINDVITNTAGAALGAVVMLGLRRAVLAVSEPRPARAATATGPVRL